MSRWSDPEGKNTRKTIFMQARKNEEKTLAAALRTLCEKQSFFCNFMHCIRNRVPRRKTIKKWSVYPV
jgi:hypothetical protein